MLILFAPNLLPAQDNANPVLIEINDSKIRVSEFEAIYRKNNQQSAKTSVDEYLDLFIKFRLKVMEAEELGLDTLEKFTRELSGYRKQLSEPYLSDNEVTDALIREAYERMKYEVKASHILIKVAQNASPSDTLKAHKRAMEIRKRVQNGEDFAKLARELSEDPSAKENSGNLGYFSVLYMIYPFESAVYNAEPGKITTPVRSQFGYHLILVENKRANKGEITVAHIMTRIQPEATEADIEASRIKINEIYDKLVQGSNFEEMATEFSEDKGSAGKGGVLPPFTIGRMFPDFEEAAFALQNDGEFTKPLRTKVGFHIIKRIRLKPIGSFEESKMELKSRIARDSRSKISRISFLNRMKKEYAFRENIAARNDFYRAIDSTYFQDRWSAESVERLKGEMFRLGDSVVYQTRFAKFLEMNQPRGRSGEIPAFIDSRYETFVEEFIIAYENARLESKYPEFGMLMKEYHDGILLFDLTDEKVWTKAVRDTAGLLAFYEANKSKHMWPDRVEAVVFCAADKTVAANAKKLVKARKKNGFSDEDILKKINENSQLNLEAERGKFSKGENEVVDKIEWKKGISADVAKGSRICFAEVISILSPQPKELSEIRGVMTSAYQNHLEEEWLKELRAKYTVVVNREHLSLIK